ncbi:hypothetical protein DQ04_07421030 [Trypanosoma grayi]|uniref:hypothetical protein n=1 Tax=Trypanosoma grayi TaxID=71804 RepID=UPI0004F4289E|nr:hypothetical protein DQ04_07421030 [Trypanosoma grayi]KEG08341.1 hypothetical protein DQ04_07421030 [Trypanosoma grayi]
MLSSGHVSVPRQGRREARLQASMGLQLRDIQVLFLVLMVVAAPFLRCAAAAGGVVPRTRMATPVAGNNYSVLLMNCFPGVVLSASNVRYACEVNSTKTLIGLNLSASYYTPIGLIRGWPATLDAEPNIITFLPDREVPSGRWELVFTSFSDVNKSYSPMTTTRSMDYMMISDAKANFAASNPYYGMGVSWAPNLPTGITASGHMLVRSFGDCQYTTTTCANTDGCHSMLPPAKLPPPGEYWLCVTSKDWRSQYLPWGVNPLEVKMLMATPLYLTAGKDRNVMLQDAESVVSKLNRVFLVRCPGNDCPRVTTGSGEEVVHFDACANPSVLSRVNLSNLHVLSAQAGVYAVCVDDGDGEYTAPAALPVTVLQEPFAFKVTADKDKNTAKIDVSGGDFEWRREPYTVCAVPQGEACGSVSSGSRMCEKSESPNSLSVSMDLTSRGMRVKDAKFCFIAADVTIGGRAYTFTQDLPGYSAVLTRGLSGGVIAGIVIGCIALLIVGVAVFYFCYWRRRPNVSKNGDYPSTSVPRHVAKKRSRPVEKSRVAAREDNDGGPASIGDYPSLYSLGQVDNPMAHGQAEESTSVPNVESTALPWDEDNSDNLSSESFEEEEGESEYTSESYTWPYPFPPDNMPKVFFSDVILPDNPFYDPAFSDTLELERYEVARGVRLTPAEIGRQLCYVRKPGIGGDGAPRVRRLPRYRPERDSSEQVRGPTDVNGAAAPLLNGNQTGVARGAASPERDPPAGHL